MKILVPITITDAYLTSATISEPTTGETSWVSAGTYALGTQRIRTTTHRVYECILAHSGRTALPENDPVYWEDVGPTKRWAPFDQYVSTPATATASMTYVISPGFFNSVAFYGLVGSSISVTVKDGPGGSTIYAGTFQLYEEAAGLYEYLFEPARPITKLVVSDITIHPTAELTVVLTGASTVECGMINVGTYKPIISDSAFGGTQYGATVEPTSYSRITIDDFGNTVIRRGHAATGMRADVVLSINDASYALKLVQSVLDVPVSWIASETETYSGLNVFGLGSGVLSYEGPAHAKLSLTVKGLI